MVNIWESQHMNGFAWDQMRCYEAALYEYYANVRWCD